LALRPNVGLGLRVDTPVGPLAFDYGFNVVRRGGLDENLGAFHFSIGVF
jgi:outer membrane translocation and assembly module TamA